MAWVDDDLIKFECLDCDFAFIVSDQKAKEHNNKLACPLCCEPAERSTGPTTIFELAETIQDNESLCCMGGRGALGS
jgi:hypothetical protein